MGRYHAPQVDDEDDGQIPMDIEDEDDECFAREILQSLAWRNEVTPNIITTITQHESCVGLDNNIWRDGSSQFLLDRNQKEM